MKIHLKWKHQSAHNISPIISLRRIFQTFKGSSVDPGPILPNFEPIQGFIAFLVTCKNKEDPMKNEGARVHTTVYIHFSNAQEQLTQ